MFINVCFDFILVGGGLFDEDWVEVGFMDIFML